MFTVIGGMEVKLCHFLERININLKVNITQKHIYSNFMGLTQAVILAVGTQATQNPS